MSIIFDIEILNDVSSKIEKVKDNFINNALFPGSSEYENTVYALGLATTALSQVFKVATSGIDSSNPSVVGPLNVFRSVLGGIGLGINIGKDAIDFSQALDSGNYQEAYELSKQIGYKIGYATLFATAASLAGTPLLPAAALGYLVDRI
jgi:hypothetical protein